MRALALIGLVVLAAGLAWAGSDVPGGDVSIPVAPVDPNPGFCWGGGIIPGPPPGYCWAEGVVPSGPPEAYWPGDGAPGAPGIGPGYGPQAAYEGLAADVRAAATTTGAEQATTPPSRRRSQMYIPAAVWRWVAEHPVRAR